MKVNILLGVAVLSVSLSPFSNFGETPEGYIHRDTANKMIGSYLASISSDTNHSNPNLNSFILNADLLRHYLNDTAIKEIKVMLAHRLDFINAGHQGENAGYRSNALTIVIAGYDSLGNYVFYSGNMIPNHATPCPRNCPDEGAASNSLLK
ncbi:MAG TPA: hypothetical protein VL098_02550 [Flavipsychrobacter sp.]|nr:hypothetical protein [Flavipsychrobacter sp.]